MLAKLCGFPFPFLEYSKWVEMDVLWMRCSVLCRMHKRDFEVGREWLWQLGLWRSPRLGFQTPMMMMIAFITIKSSLVPSIWVLYAQIYSGFETSVVWRSHLWLFFFGRKTCSRKKLLLQDLIPLPGIYIHMCTLYTYMKLVTCMPRFSASAFIGPSRCLIPTPGLTTEYPMCAVCVCVCVYTHIHPHTLPTALKIEKTQTTPLCLLLPKITPHAKQPVPS